LSLPSTEGVDHRCRAGEVQVVEMVGEMVATRG